MGVTLTTVANGDVMSSSIQRTNITTTRDWLNGGIVAGDIPSGSLSARHFRRMDHYGGANPRSIGITGSMWAHRVADERVSRNYGLSDAHGINVWAPIANMTVRGYAPVAGSIEIVSRGWYWPIKASGAAAPMIPPEEYSAAYMRVAVNNTAATTPRTLWDSGVDDDVTPYAGGGAGTGPYLYGARQHVLLGSLTVSAGWFTVGLQIKVITQAAVANYGLTLVGASSLHVEYYAK